MKAIRKILKKYAKNVEPTKPTPGFMTLGGCRAPQLGCINLASALLQPAHSPLFRARRRD